jgi:aryl-alcohol dehydrogenase-like predicted oxidoreductase
MEYRAVGTSGFQVPLLSFGTATFGGANEFFRAWGATEAKGATAMVDICLDAGVNMFDSADVYSGGLAEEILGKAIAGRRDQVIISTKASFRTGPGPNDVGNTRHHLLQAVDAALRRLGTDYIDLFQTHGYDALTSADETMETLAGLVRSGKVRSIGCSNYSGWHLMKSLAVSDRFGWPRMAAHQAYYSLVGRDYEWELMPLAADQGVGTIVWSPLGWGRLTGKIRRNQPRPEVSRLPRTAGAAPPVSDEHLYRVVDALDVVAAETGKTVPQIALNWVMHRPTIASVIIGARDEAQLRQNLGAFGWRLTDDQVARLDAASAVTTPYPYWHQQSAAGDRNPLPTRK